MVSSINSTLRIKVLVTTLIVLFAFSFSKSWGQTIVSDDFENTVTLFTNSGGTYYSGNSAAGEGPGSSPFASTGTYGIGRSAASGSAVLTSSLINISSCSSAQLTFKLASFSIGGSGNGADAADNVKVEISPDGGTNYFNTIQINGNSNAYWGYTATGVASTAYDGDVTPVSFAPAGGGVRTTDGYSTVTITGLPFVTNLLVRITLLNNSTNERWVIDNFVLSGTCSSCTPPTTTLTPTSSTICAGSVTSFTVADNASSPSYTWQASANGTTGWGTVVNATPVGATYSGINTNSLSITGGSTYFYRCLVTDNTSTCTATSSTGSLVVISAPTITSQPVSVTTTSTTSGSFTVGASGAGLTYQWKENSGSGFTNISNGGSNPTYAGATSSVLTISNPPMSMSGYSYQCVISNACGTATTNGTTTLTVNASLTCPYLVAAVINACAGSCGGEGNNEFVVMNSGSYTVPVNGTDLNLYYSGGTNHNFTDSYTAQPSAISNLNSLAGCGTLFVDASNGTIPPNSTFFVMNQGSCFDSGSFSAYCGLGTIYVAFSSDPDWPAAGYFGNNSTPRYFQTNFTTIDAGCATVTYSYNNSSEYNFGSASAGDGASVVFDGTTPSYVDGGGDCVPPVVILPIELLDFYGTQNGAKNDLIWKVAVEDNIREYVIEKSSDGINFEELTRVNPKGTSLGYASYLAEDLFPNNGITYYRLSTVESEGELRRYKIIDLDRSNKDWQPLVYQINNDLVVEFKNSIPKNSTISLYDLSGKLLVDEAVKQSQTKIGISDYATGLYFVKIASPYKTENFKIVLQK